MEFWRGKSHSDSNAALFFLRLEFGHQANCRQVPEHAIRHGCGPSSLCAGIYPVVTEARMWVSGLSRRQLVTRFGVQCLTFRMKIVANGSAMKVQR